MGNMRGRPCAKQSPEAIEKMRAAGRACWDDPEHRETQRRIRERESAAKRMRAIIDKVAATPLVLVFALMLAAPVMAHSWYEPSCCSFQDCEPIPVDAVTETADGWQVSYTGKLGLRVDAFVPRGKERNSQDGRFHGCATKVRFLCLYVPRNV